MNFFKRFTSVFFCCVLLSSFLILPASAVDDDSYYSLPPVACSEPSVAMDWPINPAEFDNNDSTTLTNIYKYIQYLTLSPASWQSNSIIGFLDKIFDRLPSNLGTNFALQGGDGTNAILDDIRKWSMFTYNSLTSDNISGNLGKIQQNTLATADRLLSLVTALGGGGLATENTLSSYSSYFKTFFGRTGSLNDMKDGTGNHIFGLNTGHGHINYAMQDVVQSLLTALLYDREFNMTSFDSEGNQIQTPTASLFHYIKNLSLTLASEDDKQLAENYKENREQAEQDFLSGKSGKTSLGKEDFGSLSGVGGTFKDITSLNGQASIGNFSDGLSSADEAGQGWFSQATKDALDSVSESSSNVSTFSVDGDYMEDVDIYNMDGFEDHYAWLWGD